MRITQNTLYTAMRGQLSVNSDSLLKAQQTVATQKKFSNLSDNPIDGGRVCDLSSSIAHSQQFLNNVDRVQSQSTLQDSTLDQVNTILARAKELLLAETNQATSTASTREAARVEIANLTTQLVQASNTRFDGKYVFSGFATDTPAYTDAGLSVNPPSIAGRAAVTAQSVSDPAQMIYHTYQVQFTAAGQYNIVDATTGTTVTANQAYASGQTIQFNGLQLTLSDSPGAPAAGDTYTVNTMQPGVYQGDSQVQMAEVQPGTRVSQNIPGNRIFSGVGVNGGVDIFSAMNQINSALRANDHTAMSALLTQLDTATRQVSTERSNVGSRSNLLDTIKTRLSDVQTNLESLRSNLEDIDVADAMIQLNKQQNTYDATLSAAAKVVQKSLLDFLG